MLLALTLILKIVTRLVLVEKKHTNVTKLPNLSN